MRVKAIGVAATAALVFTSFAGVADGPSKGKRYPESEYRHNVLEQVKYSVGNIRVLLQGVDAGDDAIKQNAQNLHTASLMMKGAFEKDTRGIAGRTDSKDAIWENWDDFSARIDKFVGDTGAMLAAAEGGDKKAIGGALRTVYSNCKACHDKYKAD